MSEKMEQSEKQAEEGLVDEAQALLAEVCCVFVVFDAMVSLTAPLFLCLFLRCYACYLPLLLLFLWLSLSLHLTKQP